MKQTEQEKKVYQVQIGGVKLSVRSTHDQKTVEKLSKSINSKVQQALNSNVAFPKALVLTALMIAEEKMLLKQKALNYIQEVETDTLEILDQLSDSSLKKASLDH